MTVPLAATLDVVWGSAPRQALDVFTPSPRADGPLLVLVHGGWWRSGDRRDLRATALHLVAAGHATATVGYRLLAGNGAEAEARNGNDLVDDLVGGCRRALEEDAVHGGDGRHLVFVGSGAGGLLALTAVFDLAAAGIAVDGIAVAGTTPSLAPWPGCSEAVATDLGRFAMPDRDPARVTGDLPPLLLLHGAEDDEVPPAQAAALHGRVLAAGGRSTLAVLAGVGHRFLEQPHSRGGHDACARLLAWLADLAAGSDSDDGPLVADPAFLPSA